jgi:chromosome partitioning protein
VKTITVLSRKGGSGKTTLAVNLAITAFLEGRSVMLADIDPQRSASDALRARQAPGPAFAESCAGKLFHAKSSAMRDGVELLIIDTPAAPETDVTQAVNISDLCLVVGRPSFLDLAPIVRSADTVRRLGREGLVVLNQAHTNKAEVAPIAFPDVIEALRFCGLPLAPVGLRSRGAFQQAIAHGQSVCEWEAGGPAAHDMQRLWRHIEMTLSQGQLELHARTA